MKSIPIQSRTDPFPSKISLGYTNRQVFRIADFEHCDAENLQSFLQNVGEMC